MFMPEVVDQGDDPTLSRPAWLEPLIEEHLRA